jgi:hypothetical protein
MRHFTVTIPDEFYDSFMAFFKHIPEVSVDEKTENDVPLWQQELVLERIKNAKPEDYIDANEALNTLKNLFEEAKF